MEIEGVGQQTREVKHVIYLVVLSAKGEKQGRGTV